MTDSARSGLRDTVSSGLPLALGILGGIALAGSVHGALYDHSPRSTGPGRGTPNRAGGRFRRVPVPAGFTISPYSFVRGYVLQEVVDPDDHGRAEPGTGLYHVTTNLPAVLADRDRDHPLGRLRSRQELRATGKHGAGLGGGGRDVMADRVSVGLRLSGAQRVLEGMTMMARAVHGQIEPDAAMEIMLDLTEDTRSTLESAMDWMLDSEDEENEDFLTARAFEKEVAVSERRARNAWKRAEKQAFAASTHRHPPGVTWCVSCPGAGQSLDRGHALYEALAAYEETLVTTLGDWTSNGWISDDAVTCSAPVGFTERAETFAAVRPENLGLLQLAGRTGAPVEFVNNECELRFRPGDLRVVGVWEER